jgi:uncharacterized protein YeaO (DUF488 family)
MGEFKIKRIYDTPSDDDGYRVLVDRLWPRGVSRKTAQLDEWNKEIAPSPDLRKWFDHKEEHFQEFALKYRLELADRKEQLNELRQQAKNQSVSLLYAAKSPEINHTVILKEVLSEG